MAMQRERGCEPSREKRAADCDAFALPVKDKTCNVIAPLLVSSLPRQVLGDTGVPVCGRHQEHQDELTDYCVLGTTLRSQ